MLVVMFGYWLAAGGSRQVRTPYWQGLHYDLVQGVMWVLFREAKRVLRLDIVTLGRDMATVSLVYKVRGKEMTGTVVYHDSDVIDANSILVIPHAGVAFELEAMKAGAVICEVGGKLAHLVTVCRELGKPIIRMDNALSKLRRGQRVTLSPEEGKIEIHAMVPQPF